MHALVLVHGHMAPIRHAAAEVASRLGARVLGFDRRPALDMYDLVVVALSDLGLVDPALPLWLASGQARGKAVAFMTDSLAPWAMAAALAPLAAAAMLGGARVHPGSLHLSSGLGMRLDPAECARARAWGEDLAARYPAPTYPRGPAGRRRDRL